jgi:AraC-like DNA-binding protein
MAQITPIQEPSVRRTLDEALVRGVRCVRVAAEPGEIRRGRYIACKTSPQVIYCLSGEARYFVRQAGREASVVLNPNDILIVTGGAWLGVAPERDYSSLGILLYPEITHGYIVHPIRNGETFSEAPYLAPFPRQGSERDGDPVFTHVVHSAVRDTAAVAGPEHLSLVRSLVAAAGREPDDSMLRALATALLTGCGQLLDAEPAAATSKARVTYEAACAEIARRCDEPLDRRMIADALRIHPNHLTKIFSEFSDLTFTEHLMATRLRRATALLEEGRLNVSEVAATCGFASANYFVRAFKKAYGHTPGQHRGI